MNRLTYWNEELGSYMPRIKNLTFWDLVNYIGTLEDIEDGSTDVIDYIMFQTTREKFIEEITHAINAKARTRTKNSLSQI